MIAVDTSALVAILRQEPEGEGFSHILLAERCALSAATLVELRRVVASWQGPEQWIVDDTLDTYGIEVIPFDMTQATFARDGMLRYGKGRRMPPEVLNFGDLFSYALARALDAPLLYKGDDFGLTDVRPYPAL
ncbi:type II toxin-antitoxin system VapC family toxin [Caenispirillum bisanense]|uniref:type II toxin-antitoxin system VapC family toxin n=1 Tax=Caenispirillum bisanense TaxID=414052 RepID=UPI0031D81FDB